jgi:hypothetical protein
MWQTRWRVVVGIVWSWAIVVACDLSGAASPGGAAGYPPGVLALWVELGPTGVAIARAITIRQDCPVVNLGTQSQGMYVRAEPDPSDFPVRVCETIIPPGTASAAVEGHTLPMPKSRPQRVVIIGDTGCRLKAPAAFQACNDAQAWPFAAVARGAARWQPDLVVHVGDYHYRESPCPRGNAGCSGSPWGDNWATWNADFFTPAAELLRAAPWVVVRGNHEVCRRAGHGWFRFLDPQLPSLGCQDYTAPYAVPLGETQLLVLDSANALDETAPPELVAFYTTQFETLRQETGSDAWLVMHHPIRGLGQSDSVEGGPSPFQLNATLQAASSDRLGQAITLVLSGHLHLFEALSFGAGRPPQLIVGHGGTALDPAITVPLVGREIGGVKVAQGMALDRFGFATLEPSDHGWTATARDVDGRAMARCGITTAGMSCAQ